MAALGYTHPIALVAFGVSTLVAASVLQELARGTQARHKVSKAAYPVAFLQLMGANRPRYGGYLAHLAIVMLAFGIVGSSFFDLEQDVVLTIGGERAQIGGYEVEFVDTDSRVFPDRTERTATMRIYRGDRYLDTIIAWQAIYPSFRMASSRAAIRSTPVEDLYVLFSEMQPDGRTALFRLLVNPLIWWMWVAGPLLLLGTVVALWPSRQQATLYAASPVSGASPVAGARS